MDGRVRHVLTARLLHGEPAGNSAHLIKAGFNGGERRRAEGAASDIVKGRNRDVLRNADTCRLQGTHDTNCVAVGRDGKRCWSRGGPQHGHRRPTPTRLGIFRRLELETEINLKPVPAQHRAVRLVTLCDVALRHVAHKADAGVAMSH